jgi:hypothetical protein
MRYLITGYFLLYLQLLTIFNFLKISGFIFKILDLVSLAPSLMLAQSIIMGAN